VGSGEWGIECEAGVGKVVKICLHVRTARLVGDGRKGVESAVAVR
jgi:hypothetical protein